MPGEVLHKIGPEILKADRVRVNFHENTKYVLDIYVLRCDPPPSLKIGPVRINTGFRSKEVMLLRGTEEWRGFRTLWREMVLERREYRDKSGPPMCQGKDIEFVEDFGSVRYRGEQPVDAALTDTLREERNDFEKFSGAGVKFLKQGETSESSIVMTRFLSCSVRSTLVRRRPHLF